MMAEMTRSTDAGSRGREGAAAALLLIIATLVLHGHVLDRFWLGDDPQVVVHASRYAPVEIVSDPDAWQELSGSNFTPLVTWSFDLDLQLAGPRPHFFYLHQLCALALCALLVWQLLRILEHRRGIALLGALLFLITPATSHVAGSLMTRHYLEGMAAALGAILLWRLSESDGSWLRPASAALLYLVAILGKEVFLLLPLLLAAWSWTRIPLRSVAARLVPFGLALALYLVWRGWILGGAGGYGGEDRLAHLGRLARAWMTTDPASAIAVGSLTAIAFATIARDRVGAGRVIVSAIAVLAPLAGIGEAIEPRHLFVPFAAALLAAMHGVARRGDGVVRRVGILTIAVVTVTSGVGMIQRESTDLRRMEAEGRYVWNEKGSAAPLLASSPGWYVEGVREIDWIWRGESSPRALYSMLGTALELPGETFVRFAEDGTQIVGRAPNLDRRDLYEESAPLSLSISRRGRMLVWSFGPDCECTWQFISYPDYQMFSVPPRGERVVPLPRSDQWFRVERREPDGSWTLSPPLRLPSEDEDVRWERNGRTEHSTASN